MITPREPLTKENILSKITSYDIFKFYCEGFSKLDVMFKSELRKDNNPSCCISQIRGDLLYSDFGDGSYRAIDYVMAKYSLNYSEALNKVNIDFNLGLGSILAINLSKGKSTPVRHSKVLFDEKKPTIIKIRQRRWNRFDKEFWLDRYGIDSKTLELFGVVPISHFWINEESITAEDCAYSYNFYWSASKDIFYRKIYQPYSKTLKWVSNGGKVCQGEGVLPQSGDLLIITKSLKDVMVLYKLGFIAISPVSETTFLPSSYFQKQGKRFERIELFFDSDTTGLKKAEEFSKKFEIDYKYIPLEYNIKDISDFIEKKGIEESKLLLKQLFI